MALSPGTPLAHYEVVEPIGSGGMGEVYRAHDTKLRRDVAIKALPADWASHPQSITRLRREAELLASCAHPNIAAIHGIEEMDGAVFLVLELVRGETLAEILGRGPLAVDKALDVARQVASALEAAHERDVVHRDLKPANVMVDESGHVKVLDFGLAKLVGSVVAEERARTEMTTRAAPLTAEGSVVGTAPYMSPEQLRGEEIDHRADIWALGCLLFELLSGRPLFQRKTHAETAAAILQEEPDWSLLPRRLPQPARRLVARCLRKDPRHRLHHAADVRLDIEDALSAPGATDEKEREREREGTEARGARARAGPAWVLAAIGFVLAGVGWLGRRDAPGPARGPVRFSVPLPRGASIFPGEVQTYLAVSPDGTRLVFGAGGVLWLHTFAEGASRELPGTTGATLPFWSPDSRFVGFVAAGQIKRMAAESGPTRVIASSNQQAGISWGDEGTILFSQSSGGPPAIFAVSADGGDVRAVTEVDPTVEVWHFWPTDLPGADRFLFVALVRGEEGMRRELRAGSLNGNEVELIGPIESRVAYVPGFLLHAMNGVLVAQRFDPDRLELSGEPIVVADQLRYFRSTGQAEFSASLEPANLVVATHGGAWSADVVAYDRSGEPTATLVRDRAIGQLRLSPSGDQLLTDIMEPESGTRDLWIFDRETGTSRRLTLTPSDDLEGVWSADGRIIAFRSDIRGPPDIYARFADGAGDTKSLLSRQSVLQPADWSSTGELFFEEITRNAGTNIGVMSVGSMPADGAEREPRMLLDTPYDEWGGRVSPDGARLAFASDESGRLEVYVAPLTDLGARRVVSRDGGISPRWGSDGKAIFYLSTATAPARDVVVVPIDTTSGPGAGSGFELGAPVVLFRSDAPVYRGAWDVTPDGETFFFNVVREDSRSAPIDVVLGWTPPP